MRFSWQVYWGGLPFPAPGWLWDLDHKEGRTPKNWCLWTVVLKKTPESPLASKEIKPVNLEENQPWILIGRTDAEAEAPVFWSPDANSQLIGKVPDAGRDWGQKEKRQQMMRWPDSITDVMDMSLGELQVMMRDREAWRAAVHGVTKSQTRLGDWTATDYCLNSRVRNWGTVRSLSGPAVKEQVSEPEFKPKSVSAFSVYVCPFCFLIVNFWE